MTRRNGDTGDLLSGAASSDQTGSDQTGGEDDMVRRDLLAGIGRFAYAAPALALLAQPRAAQADYGGGRGGVRDSGGSGGH